MTILNPHGRYEEAIAAANEYIGELFSTLVVGYDYLMEEGCQNECEPDDPDCEYCCLVAAEKKWKEYAG